ncbi:MAG: hypothetical protein GWN00_05395, partial [Aliifodinibius sp.]|nr:hypothetical protein [Phycisphaerae bacterium]NIT55679.1 hypothetical protein [Fodinibius sp.]NIW43871.1 hypothetical protein [Gammaproteobacteria bacterium]NIY24263.1 hypothetical protein [Fodinibius sp.]
GLIVIFSNVTVNSSIGLVGSLSIMILAQTLIAIVFDNKGWVGMARKHLSASDFLQVACILVGSILIIYF